MAQEIKNQNTNRKTFLIFYKDLKKTAIDSEKIKDFNINTENLFYNAVSAIKLKEAWYQIKNKQSMLKKNFYPETVTSVENYWFENMSRSLLNGSFLYSGAKKVNICKANLKFLNIVNPRVKIIERSLLNYLEAIFEGIYIWVSISQTEFKDAKINLNTFQFKDEFRVIKKQKTRNYEYQKKYYIVKKIFKSTSFGFRNDVSAHQAFYYIKTTWLRNITYFLDYDIVKEFKDVNKNRLKNTFNRYVVDARVWKEIEKMLNVGYIQEDISEMQNSRMKQNSILSFFLFNIYMHDLDQFIEDLTKKYTMNNRVCKNERNLNTDKKYNQIALKPITKCIQYIRYGDEIIVSLIGSRRFTGYVQKAISNFIKNNLQLAINKHKILHKDQLPIVFLGHQIQLVNSWKKTNFISRQLKVICKFKNKTIQRLKQEKCRIARIKRNKFRGEVLKFIDIMSKELNLDHTKRKDFDLLVSLFAYKFLGDILSKIINLHDFEKLFNLLLLSNNNTKLKSVSLRKLSFVIPENIIFNQSLIFNKIIKYVHDFKYFNNYGVEKVDLMLSEIKNIIETKTKTLSNLTISKLTKDKLKYSEKLHTKDDKKLNVVSFLSKKERKIPKVISTDSTNLSFYGKHIEFISIKANIKEFCDKLRSAGFLHPYKNQASSCDKTLFMTEEKIIRYYDAVMRGILSWFSGVDNFCRIKGIMESVMRRSCLLTLKRKFKLKSMAQAINIYTKNVTILANKKSIVKLISKEEIIKLPNLFNIKTNLKKDCNKENFNWEIIMNQLR